MKQEVVLLPIRASCRRCKAAAIHPSDYNVMSEEAIIRHLAARRPRTPQTRP